MPGKTVVTGGSAYIDIDVLSCAVAYSEALNLSGTPSRAILTPPFNETVPSIIREWKFGLLRTFPKEEQKNDIAYILVDVSDPAYFETFVTLSSVTKVFDHHYGFTDFWKKRLPNGTQIENVGACATLIWEDIVNLNLQNQISTLSCNLLYTALFANTLNFQAAITDARDRAAASILQSRIDLPNDWKASYYRAIELQISSNLIKSLTLDTKTVSLADKKFFISQLELWNGKALLQSHKNSFDHFLNSHSERNESVLINLVSIEEGKNYLISNNLELLDKFGLLIDAKPLSHTLVSTEKLWLRKELLRVALQNSSLFYG